jgi:hypothetical protein
MTFWTEEVTVSLPSSCTRVDAGHWCRSQAYEGLLRSVQGDAAAALCCCIARTPPRQATQELANLAPADYKSAREFGSCRSVSLISVCWNRDGTAAAVALWSRCARLLPPLSPEGQAGASGSPERTPESVPLVNLGVVRRDDS